MRTDLRHFTAPRPRLPIEDIPRQLRNLPSEVEPPYGWAEFRRRSGVLCAPKAGVVKWPHAAAAAGITVIVAAAAIFGVNGDRTTGADPEPAAVADSASIAGAPDGVVAETGERAAWTVDRDETRATREWLARQPAERALVRIGPRIIVSNLEDRIAWFDDALTAGRLQGVDADRVKVLEQERARLVSTLAQVRYAESLVADGS